VAGPVVPRAGAGQSGGISRATIPAALFRVQCHWQSGRSDYPPWPHWHSSLSTEPHGPRQRPSYHHEKPGWSDLPATRPQGPKRQAGVPPAPCLARAVPGPRRSGPFKFARGAVTVSPGPIRGRTPATTRQPTRGGPMCRVPLRAKSELSSLSAGSLLSARGRRTAANLD
jgi:hypothetical protein